MTTTSRPSGRLTAMIWRMRLRLAPAARPVLDIDVLARNSDAHGGALTWFLQGRRSFWRCLPLGNAKRSYRSGRSKRVNVVALTRPPITTTAKGRWISAPGPSANRNGTNPKAAIVAVSRTGVMRRLAPSRTA